MQQLFTTFGVLDFEPKRSNAGCKRVTPSESVVACPICSETIRQKKNLKRHIESQHRKYCSKCCMRFDSEDDVRQHVQSMHQPQEDEQ